MVAVLFTWVSAGPAAAQIDHAPRVQARLIAEQNEIAPGGTVAVALEEVIRPGWHTYWVNPGVAGAPSSLAWTLPEGWKAGAIEWPYPKSLPVAQLMDYGYEGTVWLLTKVTAPADAKPGSMVTLTARGQWLVCKEVCIPEDGTLSLPLTISANPSAPYATVAEKFAAARARLPAPRPGRCISRARMARSICFSRRRGLPPPIRKMRNSFRCISARLSAWRRNRWALRLTGWCCASSPVTS